MLLPHDDVMWRVLSLLMGCLFSLAGASQLYGDFPCVWVPVYAIPAVLCFLVAIKLQYAGSLAWRAFYVVHTSCCLALVVLVLVRMVRALHRPVLASSKSDVVSSLAQNEEIVGNARNLAALVITIVWMKMTKYVSDSHVRVKLSPQQTGRLLPLLLTLTLLLPGTMWVACQLRTNEDDLASADAVPL